MYSMNAKRSQKRWFLVIAAASSVPFAGCGPEPEAPSSVVVVQRPARPVLASSQSNEITLFGGLPGRESVPHNGRSRGSMLQHTYVREGGDFDCQVSRDGNHMIFASTRHSDTPDIYIKSLHGTAVTQLTSDPSADVHPALSPNGDLVAFASNRSGNWDIWVMGINGQQPIQITNTPKDEVHPTWSPNSNMLAYCALPQGMGSWEIWISSVSDKSAPTRVEQGLFPDWSPTDDRILFQRSRKRGERWFSVWTVEIDANGEPLPATELAASADHAMILPAWSHDGERIAYTTVVSTANVDPEYGPLFDVSDIWSMNVDGSDRVRLTDGHTVNYGPAWTPSGRVLFTSARSGHENIWSVMPSTGMSMTPTSVATTQRPMFGQRRVTPVSARTNDE
jgi:TolB protein